MVPGSPYPAGSPFSGIVQDGRGREWFMSCSGLAGAAGTYVAAGFGGPVTAPAGSDSAAGNTLLAAHFPATAINPTLTLSPSSPVYTGFAYTGATPTLTGVNGVALPGARRSRAAWL